MPINFPIKSTLQLRHCIIVTLMSALLTAANSLAAPPEKSAVLLPFELVDSSDGAVPFPDKVQRLSNADTQLRELFIEHQIYRVVPNAEVSDAIETQLKRYDFRTCSGCAAEVAQVVGAERVVVAWVQLVSNLILNINLEVRDGKSGEVLLNKSADIRGNTPRTWTRGIDYLVRSMVDKGQQDL